MICNEKLYVKPGFVYLPTRLTGVPPQPVPPGQVLGIEAMSNYSWIHLTDGRKFLTTKTLRWWEVTMAEMGWDTVRASNSWLVNWTLVHYRYSVKGQAHRGQATYHLVVGTKTVRVSRRVWYSRLRDYPINFQLPV